MRILRSAGASLALVGVFVLAGSAHAAAAADPRGQWNMVYTCQQGWCAGQTFPAVMTVTTWDTATGAVTGSYANEQLTGTFRGHTFVTIATIGNYRASSTLTMSADGLTLTGPGSDSNGTSGTTDGHRIGPAPTAPTSTSTSTTTSTTTAPITTTTRPAGVASRPSQHHTRRGPHLTDRQARSLAAVRAGSRSAVPGSLNTPSETFLDAHRVGQNAILAGVLVLLLVFPAELFNATFERHHERIEAAMERRLPWLRKLRARRSPVSSTPRQRAARFAVFTLAGAIIAGFLDPHFGFHVASAAFVVGVCCSAIAGIAIGALAGGGYRRLRHFPTSAVLEAVPLGLVIAAIGVLVSRLVHFEPGYLYGIVGGISYVTALEPAEEGKAELAATFVKLACALIAWLIFIPFSSLANHHEPAFLALVGDATLAAIFVGGIEGQLFSLMPLRFLPGHRLAHWSWLAWGVATSAVAFMFVNVLLRPSSGYLGESTTASFAVTYGLFALFGAASVGLWAWFRLHPDPERVTARATE